MKKEIIANLVCAVVLIFGIFLRAYTHYYFLAGLCCGMGGILLLISTLGRWQAKKAAAIIDKKIIDQRRRMDDIVDQLNNARNDD